MTDSPAVRIPLDPQEQPILDQLLGIRTQLELLRADKSTYVKSEDVIRLYGSIVEQVERLNKIRTHKRLEQNRVDTVLDDCFQLISLAYMAIGKNHEAPATYSAVSTMKRLLDHLYEAAFFSPKDLDSIEQRLQEYRTSVERGKETYSPHLITLLEARMDVCQELLGKLQHSLEKLSPELKPTYEKLVSLLRQGNVDEKFEDIYRKLLNIRTQLEKLQLTQAWSLRETDLYSFQRQLDRIDESRVDEEESEEESETAQQDTEPPKVEAQ
ncbi:putative upf0662 protein [Neofusicoccum parvum UCRNP2]|uniref:Putative upf0662 protein n=1 Tax=Botryosphaeria parva (strain UCR-NP2) TaxID=1287680 RepID=R1GED0_BOTPV|nr:putative upf0662 protein [Neofusicoccum parvum UCRNP2]